MMSGEYHTPGITGWSYRGYIGDVGRHLRPNRFAAASVAYERAEGRMFVDLRRQRDVI
jgi:hypothetical protein